MPRTTHPLVPAPLQRLQAGNRAFVQGHPLPADCSPERRRATARQGQNPYAIIVTCSDSRVIPEYIFQTGIGELFVVRIAGNVLGPLGLGSIEYAYQHFDTNLIVVMGHNHCGAVEAAIDGSARGFTQALVEEIAPDLHQHTETNQCEEMNVRHTLNKLRNAPFLQADLADGSATLRGALYELESGVVTFLDEIHK